MSSIERDSNLYGFEVEARWAALHAVHISGLMPSEVIESDDGLMRAEDLSQEDYGIIGAFNHISLREPFQIGDFIFRNKVLGKKRIVVPIASHQYNPAVKVLRLGGVDPMPVVTREPTEKEKSNGLGLGNGVLEYTRSALDNLEQGGVVLFAPQGTRQGGLYRDSKVRTVGHLLAQARRRNVDKIAFLFVGVSIEGVDDPGSHRGFNFRKKYHLNVGRTLTKDEVMEAAGGDLKRTDEVVLQELADLVPVSYAGDFLKRQRDEKIWF